MPHSNIASDELQRAAPQHAGGACCVVLLTLRKRPDFLAAARARPHATDGFVLQARQRPADGAGGGATVPPARVGFTCSRKVGNAVARNRAKRRLRALAQIVLPAAARPGWDYVLIGRAGRTAARDFSEMQADLRKALDRVHAPRTPARRR